MLTVIISTDLFAAGLLSYEFWHRVVLSVWTDVSAKKKHDVSNFGVKENGSKVRFNWIWWGCVCYYLWPKNILTLMLSVSDYKQFCQSCRWTQHVPLNVGVYLHRPHAVRTLKIINRKISAVKTWRLIARCLFFIFLLLSVLQRR